MAIYSIIHFEKNRHRFNLDEDNKVLSNVI